MSEEYTTDQNHASIKVHQLLQIAQDIAYDANLPWLVDEIRQLDNVVTYTHKEANKHRA